MSSTSSLTENARSVHHPACCLLRFPAARSFRRRIIYHAGPTNSGKTHSALEAFKNAESGIYCGPLRLLAMEVRGGVRLTVSVEP